MSGIIAASYVESGGGGGTPPAFVAAVQNTDTAPYTLNAPAGRSVGDRLVVCAGNSGSMVLATPSGWTLVDSAEIGSWAHIDCWTRVADGTSADNFAFTNGGLNIASRMHAYGPSTVGNHATGSAAGAATFDQPTVAVTPADRVMHIVTRWYNTDGLTSLGADVTSRGQNSYASQAKMASGDFVPGITGTSPTETAVPPNGTGDWAGIAVVLTGS